MRKKQEGADEAVRSEKNAESILQRSLAQDRVLDSGSENNSTIAKSVLSIIPSRFQYYIAYGV